MSESERRHGYAYNRVLIETERILDPEFSDAVVFLSGAQIEMLRNITQYLNRQETYVTEYMPGYYIAPTTADYDDILEIVADLEETLMGNPNTIWGYGDRFDENLGETKSGDGTYEGWSTAVPAGEVHVLEIAAVWNNTAQRGQASIEVYNGVSSYPLVWSPLLPRYERLLMVGRVTLKEGDQILLKMTACLDGDAIRGAVWGHTMAVPE